MSPGVAKYKNISNVLASKDGVDLLQHIPAGHGADTCQFSSGACNVVVLDESDEGLYFYSRVLGTKWCGKRIKEDGECSTKENLLARISQPEPS